MADETRSASQAPRCALEGKSVVVPLHAHPVGLEVHYGKSGDITSIRYLYRWSKRPPCE